MIDAQRLMRDRAAGKQCVTCPVCLGRTTRSGSLLDCYFCMGRGYSTLRGGCTAAGWEAEHPSHPRLNDLVTATRKTT